MHGYIGYIRVSTVKQGTKGVSLIEQRDAIVRYAERNQFFISQWFEEMETAAKRGRPVFNQAMKILHNRDAQGIILHKLDRGARNLRDWAEIGELSDQGVEIHFVNESLDLQSRGGRLSADIQAVVAADYIRNLKEETRKGFYGRLKQGLYPLPAPLGYLNQGKGNPKTIDPLKGPLVRRAFDLYSTGRYSFETLGQELRQTGLRSTNNSNLNANSLSVILNNPFYFGLIRLRASGETFPGIHEPLITKSIFDRVHDVLTGKCGARSVRHDFLFRRLILCHKCGYSLIGERQKGHVYYRCHGKQCRITSIRETAVEMELSAIFDTLSFTDAEMKYMAERIKIIRQTWTEDREAQTKSLDIQLAQVKDRLDRLTDAFLDGVVEKQLFQEKKAKLLMDQKSIEENLATIGRKTQSQPDRLAKFLELASSAQLSYQNALTQEKRELVKIITSNRIATGKYVDFKLSTPFLEIANRFKTTDSAPYRDIPRTLDRLLTRLIELNTHSPLPSIESEISLPA